ncbi:helix-turn-helix domain-containing protein [Agrobacterium genomosp. 3 str. CIP 111-78]|uniref:Helix-turn-helix domain-containing protein n=1 Tax=Agrobacterium tumefaciens TaxID=358 RepID=A0AAE6BN42_AGRTU|nr:helix-turn-helix domain-containing protein [Agrobacterium tomkonis CIP 111-78]QCM00206.1 helix-turn-helix domain-containing protein [Agrobacterium tumefaciens]
MALLDGYLTREQLAQELGVHKRTLWVWQNQPDGLPYTKVGGRLLFNVESVRHWIRSKETRPNPRRRSA